MRSQFPVSSFPCCCLPTQPHFHPPHFQLPISISLLTSSIQPVSSFQFPELQSNSTPRLYFQFPPSGLPFSRNKGLFPVSTFQDGFRRCTKGVKETMLLTLREDIHFQRALMKHSISEISHTFISSWNAGMIITPPPVRCPRQSSGARLHGLARDAVFWYGVAMYKLGILDVSEYCENIRRICNFVFHRS